MKNFRIKEKDKRWNHGHYGYFIQAISFSLELETNTETWKEIAEFVWHELKNKLGKEGFIADEKAIRKTGLENDMKIFSTDSHAIIHFGILSYRLIKSDKCIEAEEVYLTGIGGEVEKICLNESILKIQYKYNSEIGYFRAQKEIHIKTLESKFTSCKKI